MPFLSPPRRPRPRRNREWRHARVAPRAVRHPPPTCDPRHCHVKFLHYPRLASNFTFTSPLCLYPLLHFPLQPSSLPLAMSASSLLPTRVQGGRSPPTRGHYAATVTVLSLSSEVLRFRNNLRRYAKLRQTDVASPLFRQQ